MICGIEISIRKSVRSLSFSSSATLLEVRKLTGRIWDRTNEVETTGQWGGETIAGVDFLGRSIDSRISDSHSIELVLVSSIYIVASI